MEDSLAHALTLNRRTWKLFNELVAERANVPIRPLTIWSGVIVCQVLWVCILLGLDLSLSGFFLFIIGLVHLTVCFIFVLLLAIHPILFGVGV